MHEEIENPSFPIEVLGNYLLALVITAVATAVILLIGREVLGEGVIALLYLAPISWVTARWGQGPGITAAVASALAFNFFFIPPYYTLYIGSLQGWLLLGIFLIIAIVVVGRIQVGLARAQAREREAIFMYELSTALSGARSQEAVVRILAGQIQQLFQTDLIQVFVEGKEGPLTASLPQEAEFKRKPDLVLPIMAAQGLVGEIRLWQGRLPLPPAEDRLVGNLTNQGALALERAQWVEAGDRIV
jgi:two-component system sensor histidine kinase KdpD